MINWQYISKGQYPKKDIPVICVRPAPQRLYDYALCIWSNQSWFTYPDETCYSDFYDQWAYLPNEFYRNPVICDAYDARYSRCSGTKEYEKCDCSGDRKKCNYY